MSMKLLALTAAMVNTISADQQIDITENGKPMKKYAVGGKNVAINGGEANFPQSRWYLGDKDGNGGYGPDIYYSPNLLGGSIAYDVNLSQASCGCNIALYLIQMPGYNSDGSPNPSKGGDYYCDANDVGGMWCPEMDIMEANMFAWHTTPHKCDSPQGKHFNNCDRGGCGKAFSDVDKNGLGPGGQYRINSQSEFHAKVSFNQSGDRLSSIDMTLSQGSNSLKLTIADGDCSQGYLDAMKTPIEQGMTVSISSWGGPGINMSWLDGGLCNENCNTSNHSIIKNIAYVTNGSGPTPPPTPGSGWTCSDGGCTSGTGPHSTENKCLASCTAGYTFGDSCASPSQDLCGNDCSDCAWSWPSNDPAKWASKDAHCRCNIGSSPSPPTPTYTYGNACATKDSGQCGQSCNACDWSWPSNDPDKWSSKDADCRCNPNGSEAFLQ